MPNLPSFLLFCLLWRRIKRRIWWSYKFRQRFRRSKFAVTKLLDQNIIRRIDKFMITKSMTRH